MTGPRNREDAYVHLAAQLDGPASAAAAGTSETLRAMLEELREPSETARSNRPLGTGTLPPFARRPHASTEDHDSRTSDDNRRHLANRSRSTGSDTVANYPGLVSWNDEHDLLEPTSPLFRGNRGRVAPTASRSAANDRVEAEACSLRTSARIEAVVRAWRRCWPQGGNERRRPPNRALLLSPTGISATAGSGVTSGS